jgi:hypothetical protein
MVQHCCSQGPAWTISLCSHLAQVLMYITNESFFLGLNRCSLCVCCGNVCFWLLGCNKSFLVKALYYGILFMIIIETQ